jgi:hypothetical protein
VKLRTKLTILGAMIASGIVALAPIASAMTHN